MRGGPYSDPMLLNRDRALAVMDEHGLDALVATTPENVHYLSDYGTQHSYNFAPWGISAAVLPRDEDIPPTLMVHEFEVPAVAESPSWMPELRALSGVGLYVSDPVSLTEAERGVHELARRAAGEGIANRQRALGRLLSRAGPCPGPARLRRCPRYGRARPERALPTVA